MNDSSFMIETVVQIQFGIDVALAMLLWLVQLVIYPAYLSIDKKQFPAWHHRYMRTISFVVIPLILAQALCIGFQGLETVGQAVGPADGVGSACDRRPVASSPAPS